MDLLKHTPPMPLTDLLSVSDGLLEGGRDQFVEQLPLLARVASFSSMTLHSAGMEAEVVKPADESGDSAYEQAGRAGNTQVGAVYATGGIIENSSSYLSQASRLHDTSSRRQPR